MPIKFEKNEKKIFFHLLMMGRLALLCQSGLSTHFQEQHQQSNLQSQSPGTKEEQRKEDNFEHIPAGNCAKNKIKESNNRITRPKN